MVLLWLVLSVAYGWTSDTPCHTITLEDIESITPPAILVLGERRGMQPDLYRARRAASTLAQHHPTTMVIQGIPHKYQPVLDRYISGRLHPVDVPELLNWEAENGFPWSSYRQLMSVHSQGVEVVAGGVQHTDIPAKTSFPIAPGYIEVLRDVMSEHLMPFEYEQSFVQRVSWVDYQLSKMALSKWNGSGFLLVLADRMHVEGGYGLPYQLEKASGLPVHSIVLVPNPKRCYPGDSQWVSSLFPMALPGN
jgi:hypothetical protein